jgi:hypothetical protein
MEQLEHESGVSPAATMIRALAILAAVSLIVVLSGCASSPASGGTGNAYNSDTDYRQFGYANHL